MVRYLTLDIIKEDMKKKSRVVLLIIIVAGLACAVYVLFADFPKNKAGTDADIDTDTPALSGETDEQAGIPQHGGTAGHGGTGTQFDVSGISSLWYFDPVNSDRYEAFSERMQGTPMEDVVWMVEANLDLQPYSGAVSADDPESLTVLVNKFFYLPEDYSPLNLVEIDSTMLRREAADAMEQLIRAAAADGYRLWVQSGYRSFTVQNTLYEQYSANDGQEQADTYSARPGHSEHQTGLAADFNTITDAFGESPEGRWAAENSWLYGFINRYTKENTEITLFRAEPWHFRFIGKEAATIYKNQGFQSYEEFWVKYVKFTPPSGGIPDEQEDGEEESE